MTILQSIVAGVNALVRVNENFDALSAVGVFGRRHAGTSGLTWGYYGGLYNGNAVADGTVSLTDDADNYVVAHGSTGVVSVSIGTTNWNASTYRRLYKVTTAGGAVTDVVDHRFDERGLFLSASVGSGVQLNNVNVFEANQSVEPVVVSSASGAYAPNAEETNNWQITLTGNLTLDNPTNLTPGMVLNFCLDQDGTGGWTITLGSAFKWPNGAAPSWSTTAGAKNFFSGYYDGTIIRCGGGAGYL